MTSRLILDQAVRGADATVQVERAPDGAVLDARLDLSILPRLDPLLKGRPAAEVPPLVERLCGVCPAAHHLAGVAALEALLGGGPLPPRARWLRRLLHHGSTLAMRATSFLVEGREEAVALRRLGKLAQAAAGSPGHFPRTAVVGGVAAWPVDDAVQAAIEAAPAALAAAQSLFDWALDATAAPGLAPGPGTAAAPGLAPGPGTAAAPGAGSGAGTVPGAGAGLAPGTAAGAGSAAGAGAGLAPGTAAAPGAGSGAGTVPGAGAGLAPGSAAGTGTAAAPRLAPGAGTGAGADADGIGHGGPRSYQGADVALVGADGRLDPLGERLRAVSADGRVLVEGATADLWDQVVAEGRPGAVASRPYLLAGGPELGAYRVGPVAQLRVAAPATPLAGELREEWLARAGGAAAARAVQAVADVEAILALAGEVLDADEARDAGDALRAGETASARELGRVGGMANSGGMASVGTTGSSGGAVEPGEAGLAPVRSNHLRLETSRDWADVAEGSVGVGWVDGSRGLLVHRYRVGAGGVVDDALVLTPTAQNEHWLACLLAWALSAEADGPCLEAAVEAAIREADPCLPCVSAPVGHMGVAVEAVVGGEVSNGVRGGADQDH